MCCIGSGVVRFLMSYPGVEHDSEGECLMHLHGHTEMGHHTSNPSFRQLRKSNKMHQYLHEAPNLSSTNSDILLLS
ncbi:hypothetical protein CEP53_010837 [Fusarium sp. AF-6]|nr:hypothetical protein CEP53_010837 [Fusarium sp. AF-6]